MTLYEMTQDWQYLYDLITSGQAVDEETGEVDPVVMEQIAMTEKDIDKKIENTALFVKQLKSDAEALRNEKLSLEKRQKTLINTAERLERNLMENMKSINKSYYATARASVTIRDSKYVDIVDASKIPEQYIVTKKEISKVEIARTIKSGQEVAGAVLATRQNITIK